MERKFKMEATFPGHDVATQLTISYELRCSNKYGDNSTVEEVGVYNDDETNELYIDSLPLSMRKKIEDEINSDADEYASEAYEYDHAGGW